MCVSQVSPDHGLLQCSTVADMIDFKFAEGGVSAGQATAAAAISCPLFARSCYSCSVLLDVEPQAS